MENTILEEQLAKFIARCLYRGIFIYDIDLKENRITLHYTSKSH